MRIAPPVVWGRTIPRVPPQLVAMPILLGGVGLLTAYPIALLVIRSFQTNRPGLPVRWGLDGWVAAYTEPGILKSLLNTFAIAGVRVPLAVGLAVLFIWIPLRGCVVREIGGAAGPGAGVREPADPGLTANHPHFGNRN